MKNRILVITLAFSVLLFGCGMAFTLAGMPGTAPDTPNAPAETEPDPAAPPVEPSETGHDVILNTQTLTACRAVSLRAGDILGKSPIVIRDTGTLESLYETNKVPCSLDKRSGTLSFSEVMGQYTADFFAKNVLLILSLEEGNVTDIPVFTGLSDDGRIYIERTEDASVKAGSCQWLVLVSVPLSSEALNAGSFSVVEY